MRIATNQKGTLPVTKAAEFEGWSISGLFKRWQRETDGKYKYKYPTFYAVCRGTLRIPVIEEWLIKQGDRIAKALKKAQSMHSQNGKGAANV